jgi:hypothetical protein
MSWFPIGPDFVFAPKDATFKRLSRRNEFGRQGLPSSITIDPTDANTLYIAERPSSGGTSAFRTRDDGASWTPIADALQQADSSVDPSCFAVNPDHPTTIYMGTYSNQGVYVSSSRGDPASWSARHAIPGSVRKLIVDPRTSATLATTVLYAATTSGVYRSPDGGQTWGQVVAGDCWSLAAWMPPAGTAHFYATIYEQGLFYTNDPTTAWTNLNTAGIGLPAHTAATVSDPHGNFDALFVDFCRLNPTRAYLWLTKWACDASGASCSQATTAIYTTSAPTTAWTAVVAASPPSPAYGLYAWAFAVAPNSPGNGTNDILLANNVTIHRSINSGQTWQNDATWFHADNHAIAFSPESPPAGIVPAIYVGCDGGIGKSDKFVDPTVNITVAPGDYNEGETLTDTYAWQNKDHGKQSSALYQYASPADMPALSYIGCQDTGVAAGTSALGWRGIADADGGAIAAATQTDGVAVWGSLGAYGGWPSFRLCRWLDKGEFAPAFVFCSLSGSLMAGQSNLIAGLDKKCLAGVIVQDSNTTLANPIVANAAAQAATPASMNGIIVGSHLTIDSGANTENVTVTMVTATTFTAIFSKNHAAGVAVQPNRSLVARIDETGGATQISQDLVAEGNVRIVAAHPTDANILYCATSNQKVWMTNAGAAAGPGTVWAEVATGKPAGISISSIAIAPSGQVFVLLGSQVTSGGVTTPLFEISTGTWQAQTCAGQPTNGLGKLLADPVAANTLYASRSGKAYSLALAAGTWTWTDISENLPGPPIYDLWIGTTGSGAAERVLLRAGCPTRGVWEKDVSAGAITPAVSLYLRDHFVDQGWLNPIIEGMENPYDPIPSDRLWHYMCADIKLDARQVHAIGGDPDFFQTDPEGTPIPPLNHVLFDQLNDNSQNLPQTDQALAHVQVRNRSTIPADNVSVWAIYCRASGGVPALSASPSQGNAFPFWSQFNAGGTITPALPADSPWTAIGAPQLLNGISASTPQVASWQWTIPTLPGGDPGHYCMVAFVHSAAAPIGETTRMNVDLITPSNRQVGQKNLHIGAALTPGPAPAGGGGGPGPAPEPMEEYIEFHNPTANSRVANLQFDFRNLPPELGVSFHLAEVKTAEPLEAAITGVSGQRQEPVAAKWRKKRSRSPLGWLLALLPQLSCWFMNLIRRLLRLPTRRCRRRVKGPALPPFTPIRYQAQPSSLVEVHDVELAPYGYCAALLRVEPKARLEEGSRYTFDVLQFVRDNKRETPAEVGGGRYVVVVMGDPKHREPEIAPSVHPDTSEEEREQMEREGEELRYVPPWAEELVKAREEEQHRR